MTPEQKEQNYLLAEQLLAEQSFGNAVLYGVLAALAGAAMWAMIAALTGRVVGIMAMVVGAGVGYTIQMFGKGIQPKFAVLAATLAFAGCVLGNVVAEILNESIRHQMPVMEILQGNTVGSIARVVLADFGLIDLSFWIVAISVAAYVANRRLETREALAIYTHRFGSMTGSGVS